MIDVVFLLLVFFMLAARFGQDAAIALTPTGSGPGEWSGPPRLIRIGAETLRLNGRAVSIASLEQGLTALSETQTDPIVLRPDASTDTQRLIDIMVTLRSAGFTNLLLVP